MIRTLIRRLLNFFYWGWTLRECDSSDYSDIYTILHFKLKRMSEIFLKDGDLVWHNKESNKMKKLLTCVELSRRLMEEDYASKFLTREQYLDLSTKRAHAILVRVDNSIDRDKKMLFELLEKYIQYFWN